MTDGATRDALKTRDAGRKLPKVHVLGDSISKHYTPWLQAYLRDSFEVSRSEEAGDSSLVLATLKKQRDEGGIRADILLLNCGLHDIKTDPATGRIQVPLEDYRRNLKEIIGLAREMMPELVWVRPTPVVDAIHNKPTSKFHRHAADCEAYNAAADGIMAATGVPMIDLHGFTLKLGPDVYCDHVHYGEEVRRKQAAFLAGWLMGWRTQPEARTRKGG
jgi:hypothetical protein